MALPLALGLLLTACGPADSGEPLGTSQQRVSAPLAKAYCSITVTNEGVKQMETDYIAHVIQCENGGANLEALKAQAIAARSVAYYAMATKGSICDGQGCQVYSCGATPNAKQMQAAQETAGMYLSYGGMLTYGFYVAGDPKTAPPACHGVSGATEQYVTYNEGKTGSAVQHTSLGYYPSGAATYGQNRGCMGQWGARCLENNDGYTYDKILKFYYGADIKILQASGSCVTPTNQPPQGYLDGAGCNTIHGWAYDPDDKSAKLKVRISIDSAPAITTTANINRSDLCTAIGSCNHGFQITTPAQYADGQTHTVHAVAVDSSGSPTKELSKSPKTFKCAPSGGAGGAGGAAGAAPMDAGAGSGGTSSGSGGAGAGGTPGVGGAAMGNHTRVIGGNSGGCGCRAAPAGGDDSALVLLLAGLGLLLERRRRHS